MYQVMQAIQASLQGLKAEWRKPTGGSGGTKGITQLSREEDEFCPTPAPRQTQN